MKHIRKSILLIGILAISMLILAGCQEDNNKNNSGYKVVLPNENFVEYTGNVDAKFCYPKGWVSVGTDKQQMYASVDGTGTSVSISKADYPESMNFEDFMEVSKAGILEKMTVEGEIKQEKITLNGREAYRLDYVTTQEEEIKIHITQIVFIDGKQVYILTTAAEVNYYDNVKADLETVINSFGK